MKKIAKLVIMGLVIVPVTLLVGCDGSKCGDGHSRLENMKRQHGGK